MINIFKKIKQHIMKKQETDEMKQQILDAINVAQRLGADNKELKAENEALKINNNQLTLDFNNAIERVRYLAGQVDMYELTKQAKEQYSDTDKNY